MAGLFSDEELAISDDEWHTLEHNAILSTQQQETIKSRQKGVKLSMNSRASSKPMRKAALSEQPQQTNDSRMPKEDSLNHAEIDEDGIPTVLDARNQPYVPGRKADEISQREQWRIDRYGQNNGPSSQMDHDAKIPNRQAYQEHQQRQTPRNGTILQQHPAQRHRQAAQVETMPSSTQGFEVVPRQVNPVDPYAGASALQAELDRLKSEKEALQRNLDQAQTELFTAKGEITVVRNKNTNDQKLADRQVAILKRQLQEELSKHEAVVKSRDAAVIQLKTNNHFLKHELSEQSRRVQDLQKQKQDNATATTTTNLITNTPRKGLRNNLPDGFVGGDGEGIIMGSPGRGLSPRRSPAVRRTSKPMTPTKKRKLPAATDDRQMLPIRISQPHMEDPPETEDVVEVDTSYQNGENLSLLKSVLAFCPKDKQDTIVESLIQFRFPTEQVRPLSSLLLAETANLKTGRFAGDLLDVFTKLLARCSKEQYYAPSTILLQSLNCVFELEPTLIDSDTLQLLVPVLNDILQVNGKVRWSWTDKNQVWSEQNPKPKIEENISAAACLETLIIIAGLVLDDSALTRELWALITPEVVLLMLAPCQPINELALMLELITTSIFPETFGAICTPDDQQQIEMYTVDKICYLLWDPPKLVMRHTQAWRARQREKRQSKLRTSWSRSGTAHEEPEEPQPSAIEICEFRMKVLGVLAKLAVTSLPHPHKTGIEEHRGTSLVLFHPTAIARLTRLIYDKVNDLYTSSLGLRDLDAQLINRAVAILHHLLLSPQAIAKDSKLDLSKSLSSVLAGVHRFRVALSRITFREGLKNGMDEGITSDTAQRANEILEEYVTPDEAVQILEAFGKNEADEDRMVDEDAEAEAALVEPDE